MKHRWPRHWCYVTRLIAALLIAQSLVELPGLRWAWPALLDPTPIHPPGISDAEARAFHLESRVFYLCAVVHGPALLVLGLLLLAKPRTLFPVLVVFLLLDLANAAVGGIWVPWLWSSRVWPSTAAIIDTCMKSVELSAPLIIWCFWIGRRWRERTLVVEDVDYAIGRPVWVSLIALCLLWMAYFRFVDLRYAISTTWSDLTVFPIWHANTAHEVAHFAFWSYGPIAHLNLAVAAVVISRTRRSPHVPIAICMAVTVLLWASAVAIQYTSSEKNRPPGASRTFSDVLWLGLPRLSYPVRIAVFFVFLSSRPVRRFLRESAAVCCAHCGYALIGSASERCPECGFPRHRG